MHRSKSAGTDIPALYSSHHSIPSTASIAGGLVNGEKKRKRHFTIDVVSDPYMTFPAPLPSPGLPPSPIHQPASYFGHAPASNGGAMPLLPWSQVYSPRSSPVCTPPTTPRPFGMHPNSPYRRQTTPSTPPEPMESVISVPPPAKSPAGYAVFAKERKKQLMAVYAELKPNAMSKLLSEEWLRLDPVSSNLRLFRSEPPFQCHKSQFRV